MKHTRKKISSPSVSTGKVKMMEATGYRTGHSNREPTAGRHTWIEQRRAYSQQTHLDTATESLQSADTPGYSNREPTVGRHAWIQQQRACGRQTHLDTATERVQLADTPGYSNREPTVGRHTWIQQQRAYRHAWIEQRRAYSQQTHLDTATESLQSTDIPDSRTAIS